MGFVISNRRYLGNKKKLLTAIDNIITEKCEGDIFIDLFGGTGTVTSYYSLRFPKCIINDLLVSNEVIYKAFFADGEYDILKLESFIYPFNFLEPTELEDNYFSITYGDKYFSISDALKIGYIREKIDSLKANFTEKEYNILLASLIYSADRSANTAGHYEAYLKKENNRAFVYELITPLRDINVEIFCEDANKLVEKIEGDIVFLDPPYNSRDYGQYYHVIEQLVKWDNSEVKGKTAKPRNIVKSEYCTNNARDTFEDLIKKLKCRYILVTYNNSFSTSQSSRNKISYDDMISILSSKGELEIFENDFKAFNAGKTKIEGHKELIFFVKVK